MDERRADEDAELEATNLQTCATAGPRSLLGWQSFKRYGVRLAYKSGVPIDGLQGLL